MTYYNKNKLKKQNEYIFTYIFFLQQVMIQMQPNLQEIWYNDNRF